ncbi:electron transfer flavoprotein subunit beta/FixA family protein [Arthrobacter sp. MYb213]|uniref:electron transfer flavoprotein subunit beta/FixA family protein n=1 Tax=Arthrobacter sp. MYb213 TaxID=1848595 RepID=UPI000CFBC688|nr:electron transfer flavoprotein subunit beta/FixA family protein [Arthrobacter sp. MYb213]PRB70412.1 electron transfer flavoprotein subunit beta [Arthrobacter sp. MYb213]
MKIAVLIKQVPDTEEPRKLAASGHLDRNEAELIADEITERALEVALKVKDGDKKTEIIAVTLGPGSATDALRKALSLGADSAMHIQDESLAGSDAVSTARALAEALRKIDADAILAGGESTDGRGGVVPAMVAELLGLPFAGPLAAVDFEGSKVTGQRPVAGGNQQVSVGLPAVLTVTESVGEARFPKFKGIMTAKRKPINAEDAASLGLTVDHATGNRVLSSAVRPPRSSGQIIQDEGDAVQRLIAYLESEQLI